MTTQTRLIGINGRLHSGKDSAYDALVEVAAPAKTERAGFADKLKMSACAALGIPFTDAADAVHICNQLKEDGEISAWLGDYEHLISGREYLQFYGTEAHRDIFGTDFWVDALLPQANVGAHYGNDWHLKNLFPGVDVVVITDVRFPNEAQRILDLQGEVWYIDADKRLGPLPEDAHISERPLDNHLLTGTVSNNGSLADFRTNLRRMYARLN